MHVVFTLAVSRRRVRASIPATSQIEPVGRLRQQRVGIVNGGAKGSPSPWGIAWLRDGRPIITTKGGKLYVDREARRRENSHRRNTAPHAAVRGGLMDIALHPGIDVTLWFIYRPSMKAKSNRTTLIRRHLQRKPHPGRANAAASDTGQKLTDETFRLSRAW